MAAIGSTSPPKHKSPAKHYPDRGPVAPMAVKPAAKNAEPKRNSPPKEEELLEEERLQMVIERLHGPHTHFRAAQKFLKNRTYRKMNGQKGMTLYERIMAYRKLKDGEEVEVGGLANEDSPEKEPAKRSSPEAAADRRNSQAEQANRRSSPVAAANRRNSQAESTNRRDSPVVAAANRRSPEKGVETPRRRVTPKPLERSDTSFGSVDISDITNYDEGKNRTPTPQPTFEDSPQAVKRQVRETYEEKATARDVYLELDDGHKDVTEVKSSQREKERSYSTQHTAVAAATVATATRAHSSHDTRRRDETEVKRSTKDEYKENVKVTNKRDERYEEKVKDKREEKYEEKVKDKREKYEEKVKDKREEKYEEKIKDKREEKYEEKIKDKREEKYEEKVKDKREEKYEEKVKVKEKESYDHREEEVRKDRRGERHEKTTEDVVKTAVVAKATHDVASSQKTSEKEEVRRDVREDRKEKEEVRRDVREDRKEKGVTKKTEDRQQARTSKEERSIVDEARAEIIEPRTPEPETPAVKEEAAPVIKAAAAAAAAAPAPKSKSARRKERRPESAARRKAKKEEDDNTIAALDRLADRNLNNLLGKEDGSNGGGPEIDQKTLDKVFSPKFQDELDSFLRTT